MRTKIWYELSKAKFNNEFTVLYAHRQRLVLRWFNMGILVFSTGGVMGWKLWENLPLVVLIIISIVSLLRLVQPHLIMTDKQISNLESINKFYFDFSNRLEQLWFDLETDKIDIHTASNILFDIKKSETQINTIVNENIWSKPKRLSELAKNSTDEYLNRVFIFKN